MVARREPEAATTRPCQACARSHPLGLQPRPPQRRPQAPTHRSPRPKRKHRLASKVGLVTAPAVTRWLARHRALQLRRSARAWVSTLLPSTRAARILSSKIYAPHTVRPPFKMSASIESCRWFVFPFAGPSRNCSCEPNFLRRRLAQYLLHWFAIQVWQVGLERWYQDGLHCLGRGPGHQWRERAFWRNWQSLEQW